MLNLTKRQKIILAFIQTNSGSQNSAIKSHVEQTWGEISRITLIRDLDVLLKNKLIKKTGKGRSVAYLENISTPFLRYINKEKYFETDPDERTLTSETFNFDLFTYPTSLLTKTEQEELDQKNAQYKKTLASLSSTIKKKELERLTIEFSWKSSKIEGNTYTLIDTEILIKEQKEAKGHKKEEATMILNHKRALDYIFSHPQNYKKINVKKIEEIHELLTRDLKVKKGLRDRLVRIIGTRYKPLDNNYQIREALEKTIQAINKEKSPFVKALYAILMISYIQPFEDGNKRTARLVGNAILYAHNICPLSYRNVDESEYKKAVLLFYEQNSARSFKILFVQQFNFAVDNYFTE